MPLSNENHGRKKSLTKPALTVQLAVTAAKDFGIAERDHQEPDLYGTTDGKAVGTYLEQKFRRYLLDRYDFHSGNSAEGIDIPGLGLDFKTTSIKQPQSSCPFKSARQKVYGLGYSLLVFVYDKSDDHVLRTATLDIKHVIFVEKERTADFQTTTSLLSILANSGNEDDLAAYLLDRRLPLDDIQAAKLAAEIMRTPPLVGYLTISNALQWRLQYKRVIDQAGTVDGVTRIL